MLVTFYNAVISSLIMFGSVCRGGKISKFDKRKLGKIVKKELVMLWKSYWKVLRFYRKRDCTEN